MKKRVLLIGLGKVIEVKCFASLFLGEIKQQMRMDEAVLVVTCRINYDRIEVESFLMMDDGYFCLFVCLLLKNNIHNQQQAMSV